MRKWLPILIIGTLVFVFYGRYQKATAMATVPDAGIGTAAAEQFEGPERPDPPAATQYRCDGREYCSQMTSCDEAEYFLRNCPNVKMDGEGDGVPCEKQWCGDH